MKKSPFLDWLFGFEASEVSFGESKTVKTTLALRDKLISGVDSKSLRKLSSSRAMQLAVKIFKSFSYTSLRSYGAMLLSFGLLTLLLTFGKGYFAEAYIPSTFSIIIGSVFSIIAIPLFAFDIPICEAFCKLKFTDFIFFELFCLKRVKTPVAKYPKINIATSIFIAIVASVVGYFTSLPITLLVIFSAIFITLSISSPEFCFMTTVLALPLIALAEHTSILLCAVTLVNLLSFLIKVLLGKRLYHFEIYDLLIVFFGAFVLVSGIFNKGLASFEGSLIIVSLICAYFLASNIIVNKRLADNAANIFLFSSLGVGIYAVIAYFVNPVSHPEWVDGSFANEITARATATFSNPNVYAVFLIPAIVFSGIGALYKKRPSGKAYSFICFAVNLFAMALTFTRGAWVALAISFLALLVLRAKGAPKALLIPLGLLPIGLSFIPSAFINRILSIANLSDSSIASRLSIWRSSLTMLRDNLLFGIGIGSESFEEEFVKYAEDAVTAPHSHNLFLEIGIEAGATSLLLFGFLMLVRTRHIATYAKYISRSSLTSTATAGALSVFALLTFGMTDYIFYNPVMIYLFFFLFGFSSATLRISKRERDDALYFSGDASSSESASLDISLGA